MNFLVQYNRAQFKDKEILDVIPKVSQKVISRISIVPGMLCTIGYTHVLLCMHTNEQPQITDTYTLNTWTLIHAVHTCTLTDKPTIIHTLGYTHTKTQTSSDMYT